MGCTSGGGFNVEGDRYQMTFSLLEIPNLCSAWFLWARAGRDDL